MVKHGIKITSHKMRGASTGSKNFLSIDIDDFILNRSDNENSSKMLTFAINTKGLFLTATTAGIELYFRFKDGSTNRFLARYQFFWDSTNGLEVTLYAKEYWGNTYTTVETINYPTNPEILFGGIMLYTEDASDAAGCIIMISAVPTPSDDSGHSQTISRISPTGNVDRIEVDAGFAWVTPISEIRITKPVIHETYVGEESTDYARYERQPLILVDADVEDWVETSLSPYDAIHQMNWIERFIFPVEWQEETANQDQLDSITTAIDVVDAVVDYIIAQLDSEEPELGGLAKILSRLESFWAKISDMGSHVFSELFNSPRTWFKNVISDTVSNLSNEGDEESVGHLMSWAGGKISNQLAKLNESDLAGEILAEEEEPVEREGLWRYYIRNFFEQIGFATLTMITLMYMPIGVTIILLQFLLMPVWFGRRRIGRLLPEAVETSHELVMEINIGKILYTAANSVVDIIDSYQSWGGFTVSEVALAQLRQDIDDEKFASWQYYINKNVNVTILTSATWFPDNPDYKWKITDALKDYVQTILTVAAIFLMFKGGPKILAGFGWAIGKVTNTMRNRKLFGELSDVLNSNYEIISKLDGTEVTLDEIKEMIRVYFSTQEKKHLF